MVSVFCLTIAGFVVIFVHVEGWSEVCSFSFPAHFLKKKTVLFVNTNICSHISVMWQGAGLFVEKQY